MNTLEAKQNNSLRIIFRLQRDEISNEELRSKANIESIKVRSKHLLERYFDKAKFTENPLVEMLLKDYDYFKRRKLIDPCTAENDINFRNQIEIFNQEKR